MVGFSSRLYIASHWAVIHFRIARVTIENFIVLYIYEHLARWYFL